jgi:DNA-binding beta-propeller fold protein YncE
LKALTPGADRIAISPSGSSAAFYSQLRHTIEVVSGLPSAPSLLGRIRAFTLPSPLGPMAVSDNADIVLVTTGGKANNAVYAILSDTEFEEWEPGQAPKQMRRQNLPGTPKLVCPLGRASAISFLPRSSDALIADIERNQILLLQDAAGAQSTSVLADESKGISGPLAVAMDREAHRILVANSGSRTVTAYDRQGSSIASLYCHSVPTLLQKLGSQAVFRVTDPGDMPMLIVDDRSSTPKVLFVPFAQPAQEVRHETR